MDYADAVKLCGVLAAHYPHAPQLNDSHFQAYHMMLQDLPPDLVTAAMMECINDSPDFIPPAPKIRAKAAELMQKAEGVPSADDAWEEVRKSFATHGSLSVYRGMPDWSHPLIDNTVAVIGYANLYNGDNMVADRAHFLQIYNRFLERKVSDEKMTYAAQHYLEHKRQARLTEGDQ